VSPALGVPLRQIKATLSVFFSNMANPMSDRFNDKYLELRLLLLLGILLLCINLQATPALGLISLDHFRDWKVCSWNEYI